MGLRHFDNALPLNVLLFRSWMSANAQSIEGQGVLEIGVKLPDAGFEEV